jgi:hypothetical protein
MGSEIFNLKSMYLEDTVVRGARIGTKNAPTTRTIEISPGDEPVVKTGETGINKEYLIQSSLSGNDLNGYGTFVNNSSTILNYTGAQNLLQGDRIKLDSDHNSYTVTGIKDNSVFIVEKYAKEEQSYPDVQTGSCSIRKLKLDSVKFEFAHENIIYNKDKSEWGVTGMQMSEPVVAPFDAFVLDTGVSVQFMPGVSNKGADLTTVPSVYKTVMENNTSPVYDVSLSPIPYPHSSLQVYINKNGEKPQKAVEGEDYIVNYSNGSEIKYPIPPYEERDVAYLKFLGKITNETQIEDISSDFSGYMTLSRNVKEGETIVTRPLQDIIPTDDFSIKVGGVEKDINSDCIVNTDAGLATFVEHVNSEQLIDTITYPKKLLWDGISVIRGVHEGDVSNFDNLVVPGVSGIKGLDYTVYFEDTDVNNLIRDTDFIIDPESGAFGLTNPTNNDEVVLVSYYVEGEDISDEKVRLDKMRLSRYPLIASSLTLTKKFRILSENGTEVTKTRILVEGLDFKVSYVTGYITLFSSNEIAIELKATYTPMAQINCVAKSIAGSVTDYSYTILDDILIFSQDNIGSKRLIFKIENPVVSVPKKIQFDSDKITGNYNFSGSILPENVINIKTKDESKVFNVQNIKYDDIKRELTLDSSVNEKSPQDGDTVIATYGFDSDVLPYAPVIVLFTIINAGDTSFLIEGYDKTDTLKSGIIIRMDNKDPSSTNYFVIQSVMLVSEGTKVTIYGSFPENAIDPVFSVFDDQITWESMSDDVMVNTSAPVDSEQIVLNGGGLFIKTSMHIGSLLLVNNQDIYSILSVSVQGDVSTIGIYPKLRRSLTNNIKFSRLPVYDEGITTLPAEKLILTDPAQPAFTLWYNAPGGFEGSARLLFIKNKIVLEEYVSGVKNPIPYEFLIDSFSDLYTMAKAIQGTKSTFNFNVPDLGVPEYNPFTIAHSGKEDYYLSSGGWSPTTLIPFEEESSISLPYTFTVIPELNKWSLLELLEGSKQFVIKGVDGTSFFNVGMIQAFINKISGRYFFTSVVKSEYTPSEGTTVTLSSAINENMVGPYMFMYAGVSWVDLNNSIINVDQVNSIITFNGTLAQNVRMNTLLYVGDGEIYQVVEVISATDSFSVRLNPVLSERVYAHAYIGYVKYSPVPIALSNPGIQPYVQFTYTAPKTHTGTAYIKILSDKIIIKEILDNYNSKETELSFSDYDTIGILFNAIKEVTSYDLNYKPFGVIVNSAFSDVILDTFNSYMLSTTDAQYISMPCYATIATKAFDIGYVNPLGYTGEVLIKITSDYLALYEVVTDGSSHSYTKETLINYSSTSDLYDLVNNHIPGISSAAPGLIYPFSTTIHNGNVFGLGLWGPTVLSKISSDYVPLHNSIYATVAVESFISVGNINKQRMEPDIDYTIENGSIELTDPISSLDRFSLNYMGLDNLVENETESIVCSCRFLTYLPVGYRVDIYMEYLNIDQFYIQKLTERKFSEIVVVPQIEEITEQKGSGGGKVVIVVLQMMLW